jgi:uncharacterized protein
MTFADAVQDFLAQKRVAVVGVSRDPRSPANFVFRRLQQAGRTVFPVNPRAESLEGVTCYPSVGSIPGGTDAALLFTPPDASLAVVTECAEAGIKRVWLHRSLGPGSVSAAAVDMARARGLTLIPGGCPAMHLAPVDLPHKCMRWFLGVTRKLPTEVVHGRVPPASGD